ncbi:hypothetical protein [Shewanella woodyi]|uniref:hypothetical protein n=1 Tax=Shewanella woodyi TaxID=60961 RepID=UPI0007F9061B|nr:hypothetical protein [Shewanella woodyi]
MLSKPLYEILPITYIATGSISLLVLDSPWGLIAAFTIFYLGSKVYNMRSQNRRTDPVKKRKKGRFPQTIYNSLPFVYLLLAIITYKISTTDLSYIISFSLISYSLYILAKRASNRRHQLPLSHSMF